MGRMKKREVRMQHILPMRVSWHQMNESLHTNIFTPREYQVELVSCALQRNIIVCLGSATAKFFIATTVIRDLAYQVRDAQDGSSRISVVLAVDDKGVDHFRHCITRTSDLDVDTCFLDEHSASEAVTAKWASKKDFLASLKSHQVLVAPSEVFLELLKLRWISFRDVNLLVLDDCHNAVFGSDLSRVMRMYEAEADQYPNLRLLGLTASILSKDCEPHQIQDCILTMERGLKSHVEAASEITSILRLSSKCQEVIVECPPCVDTELTKELRRVVAEAQEFLGDHVYDPSAVYGEEMVEECFPDMNDPDIDPRSLLSEFLAVLDHLGPWAAFSAAVYLMIEAEKLKKKTPHERHYLLLCMVFSVFLKIRAICDDVFKAFTPVERVLRFSTPKVRRLIEILHQYRLSENGKLSTRNITEEIENADNKDPTIPGISVEDATMIASSTPIASQAKTLRVLSSLAVKKAGFKPGKEDLLSLDALKCLSSSGDGVESQDNWKSSDDEDEVEEEEEEEVVRRVVIPYPKRRRRRQRQIQHDPEAPQKISKAQSKMERMKAAYDSDDPRCLSCLIFVDKKCTAKILFALLKELSCHHPDFWGLVPFFTAGTTSGEPVDFASKEAELDHKKQEEVLRRFRMHECNVLVSTSILEEGADIPRANLVVRFDVPSNFPSYVHSMGRCRSSDARYVHLVPGGGLDAYLNSVAKYRVMAEMLLTRCHYHEAPIDGEMKAKVVDSKFPPFIPGSKLDIYGGITGKLSPVQGKTILPLSRAVALINRYCAKLPSDTFTRLTPLWRVEKIQVNGLTFPCFKCHMRLPINCPVKKEVEGPVMPTEGLAKMAAAQLMCKVLYDHGELDDGLNPIGKDALKGADVELESSDDEDDGQDKEDRPRPGTTKRRQYYYKKVSDVFRGCTPRPNEPVMLYKLVLKLACPIPEEHNTRGRKIHAPEQAAQSFGILTTRHVPNISGFPIFTRSGEVGVKVKLIAEHLVLTEEELKTVAHFHVFTFREVLRLEKYPMMFDPPDADMGFYIVPLANENIEAGGLSSVDWKFLDKISTVDEIRLRNHSDEERKSFVMQEKAWNDSVVMPWYRSQDQPQYFYVAEICSTLSPKSQFPDEDFESFEKYYFCKYGIQIQDLNQPLLDVDLTSARLNLLTPRYVNRKGVALPTCSEATKKARRENLQQKVILVPELCDRHPFPASLWRQAVCLPCILYRMNCLLLADELRARVAEDMRFGLKAVPDEGFDWPELGFGWSLADVIRKQKEKAALKEKERGERHKFGASLGVEIEEIFDTEPKEEVKLEEEEVKEEMKLEEEEVKEEVNEEEVKEEAEVEPVPASNLKVELELKEIEEESVKPEDEKGLATWSQPEEENKAVVPWMPPEGAEDDKEEELEKLLEEPEEDAFPIPRSKVFEFSGPSVEDKEKLKKALKNMMEIGTWSNDMAERAAAAGEKMPVEIEEFEDDEDDLDMYDPDISLPMNLEMITRVDDTLGGAGGAGGVDGGVSSFRYGSPSNFETGWGAGDGGGGGGWGDAEASIHPWGVRTSNWDALMRDLDGALDSSESDWGDDDEDDWKGIQFTDSNTAEAKDWRSRGQSVANGFKPEMDIYVEPREELDWESIEESEYADWKVDDLVEATNQAVEAVKQRLLAGVDARAGADGNRSLVVRTETPVKLFSGGPVEINEEKEAGEKREILEEVDTFQSLVKECKEWEETGRKSRSNSDHTQESQDVDDSMFFRATGMIEPRGPENDNWVNFDEEVDPETDPGPNPSVLLQALTMSNANDGINLERLETVGDSFLKFSVTTFLFLSYLDVHEGKLSYLRSKQVSNVHLYRLGRRRGLGERMVATKFEPHDNWLPPGYRVPPELEQALIESGVPEAHWNLADLPDFTTLQPDEIRAVVKEKSAVILSGGTAAANNEENKEATASDVREVDLPCFLPYNLLTQHSIPDKSVADCVEALIGAYLTSCGMRGALLFMSWLGLKVLPVKNSDGCYIEYGRWLPPPSPLVGCVPNPRLALDILLDGYDAFERVIGYRFYNRAYLLQAFTHASYYSNRLTDCYQRLEFLGDAVLDYLITRHLYEDPRRHSPGALTDLRSALVNNTIFASLAVKFDFHKYFKHLSPGLWTVVEKFVAMQEENSHEIDQEFYWLEEEDVEEAEDVEVPKALGDVFESVAGAIYLDSGLSLDAVWTVYYRMMREQIEKFSACVPKSPIRELLEMEPETAKFGKPERLLDGRVRVSVEVFGKGTFRGIGRNYRIAKSTAAKCALRALKKRTAALAALR